MTEKERLQALEAIDNFLSEDDNEFDENDSQLWSNYSNTSGFYISRASKPFSISILYFVRLK